MILAQAIQVKNNKWKNNKHDTQSDEHEIIHIDMGRRQWNELRLTFRIRLTQADKSFAHVIV